MFRRRRSRDDFSAEIRAHVALEAERLRQEGLSPADAESAARRAFGNVTRAEERFYERGRWLWWDEIRQDLAYSVRALRHNPIFTAAAILTVAVGIGATTAIFGLIDAVLLRPLPYPNPERILVSTRAIRTANFPRCPRRPSSTTVASPRLSRPCPPSGKTRSTSVAPPEQNASRAPR